MNVDLPSFNILSLCTGVGGLDAGVHLACRNARTVGYVEIEAYACAVLEARMAEQALDEAPVFTNLRAFDGKPWRGVVDCIVGGYPCQPFSHAGKRAGDDDPRHLWPDIARLVREVEPGRVFFENVAGHLSLGFREVGEGLQAMGYRVAAGIFSAAEVGASHRRERLFIMADLDDTQCAERRSVSGPCGDNGQDGNTRRQEGSDRAGTSGKDVADRVADASDSRSRYHDGAADGQGRQPLDAGAGLRPRNGPNGADGADAAGGNMVDAERARRPQAGSGHPLDAGAESQPGSGPMADTGNPRSQGRELGGTSETQQRLAPSGPASELCGALLFAPGPNDPRWPEILARAPGLEPAIRRVSDGLLDRLDRLRALGNAVVPLAAAYAWASLDDLLAADRAARAAAVRDAA